MGATAAVSLIRGGLWDSGKGWDIWFVYAVAGAALIDQIIKLVKEYRPPSDDKLFVPINDALVTLLAHVADATGADWKRVGVHAFRVKGWGGRKHLKRIHRLRVRARPGPVDIRWTKGKGPLGRCWETKEPEPMNFRKKVLEITKTPSEDAFNQLDASEGMGLLYKEYCKLIKHFAEVGAWPILDGNDEPIGCIVVDIPHAGDPAPDAEPSLLEDDYVSDQAAAAADLVGRMMKPRN
ncbi:hypothetical protein ACFZBP_34055 [Streptomyces sp. NPDC008086]|uniref:hypothetical protein n=1 Tax=Streptomyces sp. NPDC008086 TaxID=3364807 RepID=UPI0036ED4CFD